MKNILQQILDVENISSEKIEELIEELEKKGCKWRNLGDLEMNHARVNIVANPESTIIERITNCMDAVLEKNSLINLGVRNSQNPWEAISKILNIKDGYLLNIPEKDITSISEKSGVEVFVKIKEKEKNLFFRDYGIGLTSEEMPGTILSLNESNKFHLLFVPKLNFPLHNQVDHLDLLKDF